MANTLQGKVALITGASSGIGAASALSLAAEGAHVAVVARRGERLQDLVRQIQKNGGQALPIVADVADEQEVAEMVKHVKNTLGRIDILVNNAGVMLLGQIDGANTEDWRRMVAINVMGLMYTTHAVLPIMKEQNRGHIVNISSVAGRVARAGSGVYNVTKWGVVAFSEALRQESYKNNIRVTVIEPGAVATELTDHITDEAAKQKQGEWLQGLTPLESEDIAAAIVYAVTQPERVNVNEILIRPTGQDR
ncbi:oxidoreductase [Dictyobacter alpinus]|uniref:Oxidoreductase n=1 Tax=Dictyobacter alpinus TaxID=2014873 RepID=A0A402B6B6_9CHLR|nr:SDR family NAD(P)-dependent oxidoreductase [Dictyobacter alpinus]GCE26885.1 oxidoreductase [Dictyobacter alpinus]